MKDRCAQAALLVVWIGILGCGSDRGVDFEINPTGIREIRVDGDNLVEGTGGYYVIGSCDGSDLAESNVTSLDSDGSRLKAPSAACPGAPFQILAERLDERTIRTSVTVGPLPASYKSLSVPLDLRAFHAESFYSDAGQLFVGGCGVFEVLSGGRLGFGAIPTLCPSDLQHTGLAETRRRISRAGLVGPIATVEREVIGGDFASMQFFRNLPIDVHNSEVAFGPQPEGAVVHVAEILRVQRPDETSTNLR